VGVQDGASRCGTRTGPPRISSCTTTTRSTARRTSTRPRPSGRGQRFKKGSCWPEQLHRRHRGDGPGPEHAGGLPAVGGLNFEDAIVISESAAARMSVRAHVPARPGGHRPAQDGEEAVRRPVPGRYDRKTLEKLDDEGVIRPGTRVSTGTRSSWPPRSGTGRRTRSTRSGSRGTTMNPLCGSIMILGLLPTWFGARTGRSCWSSPSPGCRSGTRCRAGTATRASLPRSSPTARCLTTRTVTPSRSS
jgi:hypothetical protein